MINNFSPEQLSAFQAYTRLTVVSHVKGQREHNRAYSNNEVSFKNFQDVLEQEKTVNQSLSREVDQWVKDHSELQIKNHNNHDMESKTMDYVEKAYRLGFVDINGHLYRTRT